MEIKQVDAKIWRGPEPQNPDDWKQLIALEISHVLDLETGAHWLMDGSPLENQLIADQCNMIGWCHPLGAILPPTKHELDDAVELMTKYQPIYVHCKTGKDRTGLVCAAYNIKKGMPVWDAIKDMIRNGSHWWYFYWWLAFYLIQP
jgi:hypothetical protein